YMYRTGKPEGFFYLDHRTTDIKYNIITDVHITAGNVHDSVPYLERLDRQRQRFGFHVEAVALDSGYLTAPICKGLEERKIFGVIAHRRYQSTKGTIPKRMFQYQGETNSYVCPNGQTLLYSTTDRNGYRQYKSDPKQCQECPLLAQCTQSKNQQRIIT
ncbi:transposase, partial [Acinetobacter baumannii]|uniref:transposase n=1 Tax=Acinetobacter baumannii TaxID=470 RepID=UPI000A499592